ncbi:MAG: HAMP domain-containing histidine kinase [Bacilli bacterium]|nr:HAMP domain-containing histidine kinase [Bacilli bacterium]
MTTFDVELIKILAIICPILLYFLYLVFAKTLDIKKNNLILDFSLISAFYLSVRLNYLNSDMVNMLDILLIISFIKNRKILSIILSIMLIILYCNIYDIYLLIIEYCFYNLLSLTKFKNNKFLFSNIIITIKVIIFLIVLNNINLISLLIFYVLMNLMVYLFTLMDNVLNLFREITDIEKEKKITESLFKITHEIKNPIAVIKGYLDMFDISNMEHSKKYIPIIKSEINRTLTLLQDFLSISKITIEKDLMDVNMLLEDTISSLKPILNNRNVVVSYNVSSDEIYINADYNRIKQTLINIIKNSIESIQKNGHIKVSTILNKRYVDIIIEDNGCGMSKSELTKIKEAFFTTKEKGTGLGIYLSNEIIRQHDGEMNFESDIDYGTKVTIKLPLDI